MSIEVGAISEHVCRVGESKYIHAMERGTLFLSNVGQQGDSSEGEVEVGLSIHLLLELVVLVASVLAHLEVRVAGTQLADDIRLGAHRVERQTEDEVLRAAVRW